MKGMYLLTLLVSEEQEKAIRDLFDYKGWTYRTTGIRPPLSENFHWVPEEETGVPPKSNHNSYTQPLLSAQNQFGCQNNMVSQETQDQLNRGVSKTYFPDSVPCKTCKTDELKQPFASESVVTENLCCSMQESDSACGSCLQKSEQALLTDIVFGNKNTSVEKNYTVPQHAVVETINGNLNASKSCLETAADKIGVTNNVSLFSTRRLLIQGNCQKIQETEKSNDSGMAGNTTNLVTSNPELNEHNRYKQNTNCNPKSIIEAIGKDEKDTFSGVLKFLRALFSNDVENVAMNSQQKEVILTIGKILMLHDFVADKDCNPGMEEKDEVGLQNGIKKNNFSYLAGKELENEKRTSIMTETSKEPERECGFRSKHLVRRQKTLGKLKKVQLKRAAKNSDMKDEATVERADAEHVESDSDTLDGYDFGKTFTHIQPEEGFISLNSDTVKSENTVMTGSSKTIAVEKRQYELKKCTLWKKQKILARKVGSSKYRWTMNRNLRIHNCHRKCTSVPDDLDSDNYSTVEKGYYCPDCSFIFRGKNKLLIHKSSKGKCLQDCIYCDMEEHKDSVFQCDKCPKCFPTKEMLDRHVFRHLFEHENCDHCDMKFYTVQDLKAHLQSDHPRAVQKSFLCDLCGSSFKEKKILNAHRRFTHSNERPEKCPTCGRCFKTKSQLKNHLVRHKNVSDLNLSCEICGKMFVRAATLRDHVRRHNKEFSCYCSVCNKGFYRKYGLEEHMRTHTGDKPFSCEVCGYKCALGCNLLKHMRVHKKK